MQASYYKQQVTQVFHHAATTYDRLGVEFFTPMGHRLIELAGPAPGERVLDVGCGRGTCVFMAADRVGQGGQVMGIDLAPAMIEEAKREAVRLGVTNVELRVMDGEAPQLPAGSFNVVTGSYSLIFLPEAPAALARYTRILADGGRIAFTSPTFRQGTFPFLPPMFTALIPQELLNYLPTEWQPESMVRRFNSWLEQAVDLEGTLSRAGYGEVTIVDEPVRLTARSGQAWVDWSHTHGMRLLWQNLPADQCQELRERLIAGLDAMRDGDSPLTIDVPVRFVTARVSR
ncbi:MAG TPA: methyltransferase domain-containing protein [Pseudonocardiaceae bacterium]|nr:methyltransferase domain-containing protein [Pseudonocardiaceae bacterium]